MKDKMKDNERANIEPLEEGGPYLNDPTETLQQLWDNLKQNSKIPPRYLNGENHQLTEVEKWEATPFVDSMPMYKRSCKHEWIMTADMFDQTCYCKKCGENKEI